MLLALIATMSLASPIEVIWEEFYIEFPSARVTNVPEHVEAGRIWIPEHIAKKYGITGNRKSIVFVIERTPQYPLLRRATPQEIKKWRNDQEH